MPKLRILDKARGELDAALPYLSEESPNAAATLLRAYRDKVQQIRTFPWSAPEVSFPALDR